MKLQYHEPLSDCASNFILLRYAKVDCDTQSDLKAAFEVGAFPTILAFPPGSMQSIKYEGNFSPGELVAWANEVAGTRAVLRGHAAAMGEVPELSDEARQRMKERMERERGGGDGGGGGGGGGGKGDGGGGGSDGGGSGGGGMHEL